MKITYSNNGQAMPSYTKHIDPSAFTSSDSTEIYWLGNASTIIHSHSTNILIDPLLEGFDMKGLIEFPITSKELKDIDGVLLTHIDNDHFSRPTCTSIKSVTKMYHAPGYVADVLQEEGYPSCKHDINECFSIKDINICLTPAKHDWQNYSKKWQYRKWEESDYCGYYLTCKEGKIWMPGDSKLLECQLHMEEPDVILFDFSDNEWHITFDGAVKLANAYPNARLLCIHWRCVDASEMTSFNADPNKLKEHIVNPERVLDIVPGEKVTL